MIKHGVVMVALLILTLSLLGVVSASDVTASDVVLSFNHENAQIDVTNDYGPLQSKDLEGNVSLDGDVESDNPVYLNSENVEIDDVLLDACVDEMGILGCDVELLGNDEKDVPVSVEIPSMGIGNDISDENYNFGHEITVSADGMSNFENADEILAVAEIEQDEIDNVAVENILNGIYDASNGYVTYGKGNLVKLSSMESDLNNIAFFINKGEFLTMVFYKTGDMTPAYSNNVGSQDSVGLRMKLEELLSSDGASSSAKSNSDGSSKGILSFGEYESHDLASSAREENMIQNLLEYNLNDDTGLLLQDTERCFGGVSGDSDDDAFIWNAPDKNAYFGVDSNDNNMIGFNMEDNTVQSGMITVMSYDQSNVKEMQENNLNPDESVLGNPQSLRAAGDLTPDDIEQIGVEASIKALEYFKSRGIDVDRDYRNFYALTSAGHVKVGGLETWNAIKGIYEVLGLKMGKNVMSINTPLWKDLVFYFLWVNSATGDIVSYGLKYIPATGTLVESSEVRKQGDAIAYSMGLYGKHPAPAPRPPVTPSGNSYAACAVTSTGNNLVNNTNATNSTGARSSNLSDVKKSEPKKVIQQPAGKGSPYNILYNLAAICIICIIFGASYSKR